MWPSPRVAPPPSGVPRRRSTRSAPRRDARRADAPTAATPRTGPRPGAPRRAATCRSAAVTIRTTQRTSSSASEACTTHDAVEGSAAASSGGRIPNRRNDRSTPASARASPVSAATVRTSARFASSAGRARVPDVGLYATPKRPQRPRPADGFDRLHLVRADGAGGFAVQPMPPWWGRGAAWARRVGGQPAGTPQLSDGRKPLFFTCSSAPGSVQIQPVLPNTPRYLSVSRSVRRTTL